MNFAVMILILALLCGSPFIFLGLQKNNKRMVVNGIIIIITGALHYLILGRA